MFDGESAYGTVLVNPEKEINEPPGIEKLLREHRERKKLGEIISAKTLPIDLTGLERKIISTLTPEFDENEIAKRLAELTEYNPSKLVQNIGYLRVEPILSELSVVVPFVFEGGVWRPNINLPYFPNCQDPCVSYNQDANIISMVQVTEQDGRIVNWKQPFYKCKEFSQISEPFAFGPDKMKDIRIKQLPNGKWTVFTRPQSGEAGRGKIGYIEIDTLDELEQAIPQAIILQGLFKEDEWGGVNDILPLNNDKIGLLGHIARFNPSNPSEKEYYPLIMIYSREKKRIISQRIVLEAKDLPYEVEGKREDLKNVIFAGGMVLLENGKVKISFGSGDTKAGEAIIDVPEFLNQY